MGWRQQQVIVSTVIVPALPGQLTGIFVYSGNPAHGNLIAVIAAGPGTDPFGNPYPAIMGIAARPGQPQLSWFAPGGAAPFAANPSIQGSGSAVIGTRLDISSGVGPGAGNSANLSLLDATQSGTGFPQVQAPLARMLLGANAITSARFEVQGSLAVPTGVPAYELFQLAAGDQSAAIAALANSMTGGGVIELTSGVFEWDTAQSITQAGVTIRGAGWLQSSGTGPGTVLRPAAASWAGGASPMLTLAGEGVTLQGIEVSGGGQAASQIAVTGINCKLTDCATRDPAASGVGLDIQGTATSCRVLGGRYNGTATSTIGIQVNATDAIIMGCTPVNQQTGIMLLSGSSGTLVEGNHITTGLTGQQSIWVNGHPSNLGIVGNRFDNFGQAAVQLTPDATAPHNIMISDNVFQSAGQAANNTWPLIAYDTSANPIRGLSITGNTAYSVAGDLPSWFLDAITQAGAAATNTGRVGTGGTLVNGNQAWLANAGFWKFNPTVGRGNMVTTDGTTYAAVADV